MSHVFSENIVILIRLLNFNNKDITAGTMYKHMNYIVNDEFVLVHKLPDSHIPLVACLILTILHYLYSNTGTICGTMWVRVQAQLKLM